jgi:hypothetical protein
MKTFAVRAPGHDPDPSLSSGALDTDALLTAITPAQRNALLRRGAFAPATYGRVRFHHRTTQEYLTASWMLRLLANNCPVNEIHDLIFTERYGVPTTVPSLRPAAAWLALKRSDILDELIERDPLVLIRNGDPGSLTLDAKKRILLSFAKMHAESRVADDSLDNRAIALFAEPELADAIKAAWKSNKRSDFRLDLLRMIREGKIADCTKLLREVVLDKTAGDYHRIVSLQALEACGDEEGLKKAADLLKKDTTASKRLKSNFAKSLFPSYLTVPELLKLIDDNPAGKSVTEGFDYAARELYDACTDAKMRTEFASGLAELCLTPPFNEQWNRVAKKHKALAKNIHRIATREVKALGENAVVDHVVRLLMVVERVDRDYSPEDDEPHLRVLVSKNLPLKCALFWADVEEQRVNGREGDQNITRFWQAFFGGQLLWGFGPEDLEWLYRDLLERDHVEDKRIALSAIWSIVRDAKTLDAELPKLHAAVAESAVLKADLDEYLAPPKENAELREHERKRAENEAKRIEQEEADKKSWQEFSDKLNADPTLLTDEKNLLSWKAGAFRLYYLTRWLRRRAGNESGAALQWRLLAEGFGEIVAEGYHDAMNAFWRLTKPERPKRGEGSGITTKQTTILAFEAIGIEAAENPEWAEKLSEEHAKRALGHACLSEQGVPDWLYDLLDAHPKLATAAIRKELLVEWKTDAQGRSDYLYHFAGRTEPFHPAVEPALIKVLSGEDQPEDANKLDTGLRIVSRLTLSPKQAAEFAAVARDKLADAKLEIAMRNIALLLIVEGDKAISDIKEWLAKPKLSERRVRAEALFAYLFDRHDPVATGLLKKISVPGLETLLRLAYHYIRAEDDQEHEGSYSPNTRDHAENARNVVLGAIIERPGPEAYHALQMVALDPDYAARKERFLELARLKAETDSEFPAWTAPEVVTFEKEHTAPVKTGEDLLRVVMAVLSDIQTHLHKGDVNSRVLFERAQDEDEVRNYVVEQMVFRSKGRFHAYREAQVANKDRPDIIVASTSAPCEVGMEVKHGGKKWTHTQLTHALDEQLAEDYLKSPKRRHGVLVITKHGARRWRDAETKVWHTFESIIGWLQDRAKTVVKNSTGAISVRCFGLDATEKNRVK